MCRAMAFSSVVKSARAPGSTALLVRAALQGEPSGQPIASRGLGQLKAERIIVGAVFIGAASNGGCSVRRESTLAPE